MATNKFISLRSKFVFSVRFRLKAQFNFKLKKIMTKTRFLSIETLDGIVTLKKATILNPKDYMIQIKWYFSPFDCDHEILDSIIKSQLCVGRNFERTDDYIIFSFPICGIRELNMLQFDKE